jgi:hypothetical protein
MLKRLPADGGCAQWGKRFFEKQGGLSTIHTSYRRLACSNLTLSVVCSNSHTIRQKSLILDKLLTDVQVYLPGIALTCARAGRG